MPVSITHLEVPVPETGRRECLGLEGSVAHVEAVLGMISGRWKLPILFRLFAEPAMRTSQLLKDMPRLSQKVLTQNLRELESDGLVARQDFDRKPPHVEYRLTDAGHGLMPVLMSMRNYSRLKTDTDGSGQGAFRA